MAIPVQSLLKHWSYRLFAPDKMLQYAYDAFRRLLEQDIIAHGLMAEFEELLYNGRHEDIARVAGRYEKFSRAVLAMVESLETINPTEAGYLREYYRKFDFYIRFLLTPPEQFTIPPFVVSLETKYQHALLGNKGYNLARLRDLGFSAPEGFVLTTTSYFALLEENHLREPINERLALLDPSNYSLCSRLADEIQQLILAATIPERILSELDPFIDSLKENDSQTTRVAVRSSAQREDGTYSFAGQYESILGVSPQDVSRAYLQVIASKYAPKALLYRIHLGFMDEETPIAVVVQKMVNARISGVIYTHLPYGDSASEYLLIECVHGLGELLVGGQEVPETYLVHRTTLEVEMANPVAQQQKLILTDDGIRREQVEGLKTLCPMLSKDQVITLAETAIRIEEGFGHHPQDIEWSFDDQGEVVILQSRPLSFESGHEPAITASSDPDGQRQLKPIYEGGITAARGVAFGPIVHFSPATKDDVVHGSICVVRETPPSLLRLTSAAAGIIAEKGSISGHFSTVCREKKIPLLVNAKNVAHLLPEGTEITLDVNNGMIYRGNVLSSLSEVSPFKELSTLSYTKRIGSILRFITPLRLTDPKSEIFSPQGCRSMHDIIRYTHERSLEGMFCLGEKISGKSKKSQKIKTHLPIDLYVLDLRQKNSTYSHQQEGIAVEMFHSPALSALWGGLSHRDIDWHSHQHFDWKSFDEVILGGGIASSQSGDLASYAIIGQDYLNVNMRFGYHFTLVDSLCGSDSRINYCQIRFAGGGGEYTGRHLRIQFIEAILHHYGFTTTVTGDLIDGRLVEKTQDEIYQLLSMLGKLLGTTKLMDLALRESEQLPKLISNFIQEDRSFSP